ncbi:MAG: murein biosynthesis integral membrane protein MurJ [Alphaproteobacteria bacterium]|nr:murein biosynthesis integral membrane protein MurJ [Alphaproteobacteria bacterium]
MKLFKAMATVAGLTGLSRILGFIRDILTAAILGAGPIADAFFVALKLPNFFRRVTAEGAFSVSFVPLYSEKIATEGEEKADLFASNAFAVMLLFLVPFTLLALIAMPFIIYGIAPGFIGDAVRYDTAVELSRVTFPYLLLMSLTALMGGVLNARDKFAPFAGAPILFNLSLIIALVVFTPVLENAGHAMAWGVLGAGAAQFLWLLFWVKKHGVRLRLKKPEFTGNIKKLFKLMGPGVIGAGVVHVNLLADLIIASLLASGSISYLYYADRLNQLPLGMVGIAVGTALLPMLSKSLARGDVKEGKNLFNRSMEVCLLLAFPAAVALLTIPETLISVLFERGAFTSDDTSATAYVLMAYAIGLPAYVSVKIYSSVFWAKQDTVTPVKISVVTTILNIVLSLVLIQFIGVVGIALSTGLVGWLQFILLRHFSREESIAKFDDRLKKNILKILGACLVMAVALKAVDVWLFDVSYGERTMPAFVILILIVFTGLFVYSAAVLGSGAIKLSELKTYMKRK